MYVQFLCILQLYILNSGLTHPPTLHVQNFLMIMWLSSFQGYINFVLLEKKEVGYAWRGTKRRQPLLQILSYQMNLFSCSPPVPSKKILQEYLCNTCTFLQGKGNLSCILQDLARILQEAIKNTHARFLQDSCKHLQNAREIALALQECTSLARILL